MLYKKTIKKYTPSEPMSLLHDPGDVLLHTVTDAILGALCLPDIGQLFPDTDPKWKGARSDIFLKESVRLMKERGYELGNIDCTIVAQRPKLSPHKETIRAALCALLGVDAAAVNIKVGGVGGWEIGGSRPQTPSHRARTATDRPLPC